MFGTGARNADNINFLKSVVPDEVGGNLTGDDHQGY